MVQVVLENYRPQKMQNDGQVTKDSSDQLEQEAPKTEDSKAEDSKTEDSSPFVISAVPLWENIVNVKGGVNLTV